LDFLTILKWDGDRYKSLLTSALIGVGLAACIQFLAENLSNGNYFLNYKMPDLFEGKGAMFNLGYFILLALIPGICEEILFRGIIFQSLRKQYPLLIATLLSGVFFSIVHIAAYKQFYYFPLGIILAINYEKRGIANCIITHVCFNATLVFWGIY
jgi:membrane protease YdiL (CAAX protease family)